jgi:hypothetical protein
MSNELIEVTLEANEAMSNAKRAWENGNSLAKRAIDCYLETGRYLLQAREQFPGDKEFGQYRQQVIPDMSTKWAGDLMRIARRFSIDNAPDTSISVLKEIASAPDSVIEEVRSRSMEGEKLTVKEARDMVRQTRDPDPDGPAPDGPAPVPTDDDVSLSGASGDPVRVGGLFSAHDDGTSRAVPDAYERTPLLDQENPIVANERALLQLPEEERLEKAENYWHMMGFSRFFENPAVYSSISIVEEYICAAYPQHESKVMSLKKDEEFL